MNLEHIDAMLTAGVCRRYAMVGETKISSNGFIALERELADARETPKIAEYWPKWALIPCDPSEVKGMWGDYNDYIYRMIGDKFINEAYYRCFAGKGITFTAQSGADDPVLVHRSGVLVAAIMPIRSGAGQPAIAVASDEQVFAPFAREENGWYLCVHPAIRKEIEELETELEAAEERQSDAASEIVRIEREITRLNAKLLYPVKAAK